MKLMAFEMASVPVRRLLHDAVERVLHPRDRLLVEPVHLQRPRHRQHHNAVQLLEGGVMRRLFGFHLQVDKTYIVTFVCTSVEAVFPPENNMLCISS